MPAYRVEIKDAEGVYRAFFIPEAKTTNEASDLVVSAYPGSTVEECLSAEEYRVRTKRRLDKANDDWEKAIQDLL